LIEHFPSVRSAIRRKPTTVGQRKKKTTHQSNWIREVFKSLKRGKKRDRREKDKGVGEEEEEEEEK